MPRSALFADLARLITIARYCNDSRVSTAEGLERVRASEARVAARRLNRREHLIAMGQMAAGASIASIARPVAAFVPPPAGPDLSVGIVGAGLAGLACADTLRSSGITPTLYEAGTRPGGRCVSLRGLFPGQVAERGGEFIDNPHKTMLGYARRFNLALEDLSKEPGEVAYFFGGQHWPESTIVDELRDFVAAMHFDLRSLSGDVTADAHTDADVRLDRTNLLAYLEGANGAHLVAGPILKKAIVHAYIAEYGLDPSQQSCLNFLLFIHADKRSKFTPFGVFSDERWHVVDGNDRIVAGLAGPLTGQIELDMRLVRVRKTASGRIELAFKRGTKTVTRTHDAVVLAIPFTVLREVELAANLGLTPGKRNAIQLLGYGTNAKMMIGFSSRPWAALGSNGTSYSDLPNHQCSWETNPARATAGRAILTDYSGAQRGARLDPRKVQEEARRFLADLDRVYPGASSAASQAGGQAVAHLEHWPSNPLARGSYTCYLPGQFTTIAGIEGKPAGNLYFAGEHANSFYEWQGFQEGAALSGIQAAADILQALKWAA